MRIIIYLAAIVMPVSLFAQLQGYSFKREIRNNQQAGWCKIEIPDAVFENASPGLSDLRIVRITEKSDTIQAPYLIRVSKDRIEETEVDCRVINQTRNEKGFFFTLDISKIEIVNTIELKFNNENFDWRVNVSGSQDQVEWFEIVNDYRILSLKNNHVSYSYTTVRFRDCKYKYLRFWIKGAEMPELASVLVKMSSRKEGSVRTYPVMKTNRKKVGQQEVIDVCLKRNVPVSGFCVRISDTIDCYRPYTFKALMDSFKTETGWHYDYQTLASGYLTSFEPNEIGIHEVIAGHFSLIIENGDNLPLTIDSLVVEGFQYEMIVRFPDAGNYCLYYGNTEAHSPNYDLVGYIDKIPENMRTLAVGEEIALKKVQLQGTIPLFISKNWLWGIMIVILFVLGWFSVRMIQKKQ